MFNMIPLSYYRFQRMDLRILVLGIIENLWLLGIGSRLRLICPLEMVVLDCDFAISIILDSYPITYKRIIILGIPNLGLLALGYKVAESRSGAA